MLKCISVLMRWEKKEIPTEKFCLHVKNKGRESDLSAMNFRQESYCYLLWAGWKSVQAANISTGLIIKYHREKLNRRKQGRAETMGKKVTRGDMRKEWQRER